MVETIFCAIVILLILGIIYYTSDNKDTGMANIFLISICLLAMMLFTISISEDMIQKKGVKEYLKGNIKVEYHKVYNDSILIKTDTIIVIK